MQIMRNELTIVQVDIEIPLKYKRCNLEYSVDYNDKLVKVNRRSENCAK